MKKKKLQVFISSTFIDLKEERQAAVQAILSSGHIPAGMELFTAGDESQMNIIKQWIEDSDVYLLILGGRYGSLEPTTEKSYTHLEYEYAISLGKPFFAVVITDEALEVKIKNEGSSVIEKNNPDKLKSFRDQVLSRIVKFFDDSKDIKLAIHETISEFERRSELIGWVRSDKDIDTGNLAEELARLTKENSDLRSQISELNSSKGLTGLGLTVEDLEQILKDQNIKLNSINDEANNKIQDIQNKLNDNSPNLFHFFLSRAKELGNKSFSYEEAFDAYAIDLERYGVAKRISYYDFILTEEGRKFYLRCILKYGELI